MSISSARLCLWVGVSAAAVLAPSALAATSVSRDGVTWTFGRDYATGQYVNGDPWVVGPVTITAISPEPADGRNGTMVNPPVGTTQGFDKDFTPGYNDYVPALNVGTNLPLTVPPDCSIVSSITADGWTPFYTIETFAILTVVREAPAAGSFRPCAIGSGSRASVWNASGIDYARLNALPRAPLSAAPPLASYVGYFSHAWLELNPSWTGRYLHPPYMGENGYGQYIAYRTGIAALLLNLDYSDAEKRDLLIGVIQVGLDNYGFITQGGLWAADGGHNVGRLAPLVMAAGVLNDPDLKAAIQGAAMKFQEYQSTFLVTTADVALVHGVWDPQLQRLAGVNGDPVYDYTAEDVGLPEWGIRHTWQVALDNNWFGAAYRSINGATHLGPTMAARVMGLRKAMNWEALFLYAERHVDFEQSIDYRGEFIYNETPLFFRQFYNTYKEAELGTVLTPTFDPPGGTYADSQSVTLATLTPGASIRYTLDGRTPTSTSGTVCVGPVTIASTGRLQAIACKSGMTSSRVAGGAYTIGVTPVEIVNGSFEDGTTGWVVSSTDTNAAAFVIGAHEGRTDRASALVLGAHDARGNAVFEQAVPTTAGTGYALPFDFGAFGSTGRPQLLRVEARHGTNVLAGMTVSADGPGTYDAGNTTFQSYALTFTAAAAITHLRFRDLTSLANSGACDGILDHVGCRNSGKVARAEARQVSHSASTHD
ncbi:MAG: chitobiase/beta-hexosaminidase C-terminal domain-containing protein [Lentisphaerae bacterium]|nr:chitobiase/beta-hexosaminidase C-terminal domain-containing protein [Lentisphaerota bacterium]